MKVTPQRMIRAAGNRAEVAFRFLLRLYLPFDPWHRMPLAAKDYARRHHRTPEFPSRNRRGRVADIGCGLGDILLNLDFEDRLGLDNDPAVLRGAEIVRRTHFRGNARFAVYSFPGDGLDGGFDAIILVGWLHAFQPDPSKAGISRIFRDNVNPAGASSSTRFRKTATPIATTADFLLGESGRTRGADRRLPLRAQSVEGDERSGQ